MVEMMQRKKDFDTIEEKTMEAEQWRKRNE